MAEFGEPLSDRELSVLELLADGSTNREIALDLDISPNTVKVHLRNIFTKLGVSSRTEATTVAIQKGLLSVPGLEISPESSVEGHTLASQELQEQTDVNGDELTTPAGVVPSANWRLMTFALLPLVGLLLGVLVAAWLIGGDGEATGPSPATAEETFAESRLGDSNWHVSRPMPGERANMALAAVGLNLYQIGGEVDAGVVNLVDVFQTDRGNWESVAAKPTAVADATAAVLFGEVYVPGGRLADRRPTSVVEAYSPANDAWRPVAPLPAPIAGGLTLSDGNLLYHFGGWDGEQYVDDSYTYDPSLNSWQALPPMAQARAYSTGALVADRLYVVGGSDDQGALAVCEYFDQTEMAWFSCPDMLVPRSAAGAAALNNAALYVIGGGGGRVPYGEFFDTIDDKWEAIDVPMFSDGESWHHMGVTSVETRIYALGGRQADKILSTNYVYVPFIYRTFLPSVSGEG